MMLRRLALASVLLIASSSAPAMAGTAGTNLTVSATVGATCSISTTALTFAIYSTTVPNDATASVITNCTSGLVGAKVTFGQGQYADTTGGSTDAAPIRRLSDGSTTPNYLTYNLYSDAGRGIVWGNTPATGVVIPTATGSNQTTSIYGRIDANQTTAPAGNYSDTVVATVTY
ncbi:MAG: spore coat U domain-containing protein [Nostoc sp.]|uniref:Csu type fimbrial protein n=1 Tax=Nostoc sp. TaxID=1180 RepID=UPI002FF97BDC